MKITSAILVLLLVSTVASLSMRSHSLFVMIDTDFRIPKGSLIGTFSYTSRSGNTVTKDVLAGTRHLLIEDSDRRNQ